MDQSMSEHWFLECLDHDPPISSERIAFHDDDELMQIAGMVNKRPFPAPRSWDGSCEGNAVSFLSMHPHCAVGLVNEYGVRRAADGSDEASARAELRLVARELEVAERSRRELLERQSALRGVLMRLGMKDADEDR